MVTNLNILEVICAYHKMMAHFLQLIKGDLLIYVENAHSVTSASSSSKTKKR